MTAETDREHFIPLRVTDLVDALCRHTGPRAGQRVAPADQDRFRRFAKAATAHVHARYLRELKRLKDAYAPFDPDADTTPLRETTDAERAAALADLFDTARRVLRKANYVRLDRPELERVMKGASDWGLDMDVCWDCFDRLDVYVRGQGFGTRTARKWYHGFRKRPVAVPTFGRVVTVLKQKPHPRLDPGADTANVFLKLFKDIPRMDVEMLLPGTRVRMPPVDRWKLGGSCCSSVAYVGYKLSSLSLGGLTGALFGGAGVLGLLALYTPLALLVGYGYNTYSSFQTTRQTYLLQLHRSLYYQNLDNNAGVLYRVLDEAEEQEAREVLLGYFYLWRFAGGTGWTAAELDAFAELDLERTTGMEVDFEVGDALAKLVELGAAERHGDRYVAVPVRTAVERLEGWAAAGQRARRSGELFATA